MAVVIRPARREDAEALLRVKAQSWREAFYAKHGFEDHGAPAPMDGAWAGLHEQRMVRRG